METYFEQEVSNVLDSNGFDGLKLFLNEVCGMKEGPTWFGFH